MSTPPPSKEGANRRHRQRRFAWIVIVAAVAAVTAMFYIIESSYKPASSPEGTILYGVDSEAHNTELWTVHYFGKEFEDSDSEIRFLYRITGTTQDTVNLTAAWSGSYVDRINNCSQNASITTVANYDSLPQLLKDAQEHDLSMQPPQESTTTPNTKTRTEFYGLLNYQIQLKLASASTEELYYGEGQITCEFDSKDFTQETAHGFRAVIPGNLAATGRCDACPLTAHNFIEVDTDEDFYYVRGTEYLEVGYSDESNTELSTKETQWYGFERAHYSSSENISVLFHSEKDASVREIIKFCLATMLGAAVGALFSLTEKYVIPSG